MKHLIIAALIGLLSLPAAAATSVGKVILSFGQNVAVSGEGEQRSLKRQSDIYEDDLLKTSHKGRLQIRFSDGSRLSLKPGSEFRIAEYSFDAAQPDEGKAIYQLLKGGMRTISGQIGKKNRDNYEMKTAVATIGIRGTHYGVEYTGDGIYAETVEGVIAIRSEEMLATIRAGEGARVSATTGRIDKGMATGQTGESSPPSDTTEDQAQNSEDETAGDDSDGVSSTSENQSNEGNEQQGSSVQNAEVSVGSIGTVPAADPNQQPAQPDSVAVVAPDPTGAGQASPAESLVAVAFTNIKDGQPKGSNGAVYADGVSQITVDTSTGTGNLVTGVAYVDLTPDAGDTPCAPCVFTGPDTVAAVISQNNYMVDNALVTWGRWNAGFSVSENGADQNLAGTFHFMHADKLTTQAELDALARSGSYIYAFGNTSSKLTAPEVESGNTGGLIPYNTGSAAGGSTYPGTYVVVNLSDQTIDEVSILAQVDAGGGARTYHLMEESSSVSLDSVLRGGSMKLTGECSGADCTSGVTNTSLSGRMTFDLVGRQADAAVTSYGASGTKPTGGDVSITGTVLLENVGQTPP